MNKIIVKGARVHNLKNIDLELPREKFIVISGLSGSGKSSLAFDTIFAEGQRRYVESLSAYARQFLDKMDKPDVDYIEGLSPAISIEQKTTNRNPRSTVGTITEIYDYLRLLYSRIGIPHDPETGAVIEKQSVDQVIARVLEQPKNARLMIMAPVVRGRKGEHKKILEDSKKAGFVRCRINGEMLTLEDEISLDKKKKHDIDIIIDRLVNKEGNRSRIADSIEQGLELTSGLVKIYVKTDEEEYELSFSEQYFYPNSTVVFPELEPRMFSFNNPFGACPACSGLGSTMEFDPGKLVPDDSLSFNNRAMPAYNPEAAWVRSQFDAIAQHFSFDLDTPIRDLPEKIRKIIYYGSKEEVVFEYVNKKKTGRFEYRRPFPGIVYDLERRYHETTSQGIKQWLEGFMTMSSCPQCKGRRLRPESLAVKIQEHSIFEISEMSVRNSLKFFQGLTLEGSQKEIAAQILKEIIDRLQFLEGVGLEYLALSRNAGTLSGGEAQRIRLATQIGSQLMGVLYVLDEPSIGLHQRDNERLIKTLLHLRDIGNTLLIVEHDEQTLRSADYIIDLGLGAGVHGGNVVASGPLKKIISSKESLTGKYLRGDIFLEPRAERRPGKGTWIEIIGAKEHNLQGIDVRFPQGVFSAITGVSGSGKSTLMSDILYPRIANILNRSDHAEGDVDDIRGLDSLDKIINIDQSPIGRTPRSNPATYVGLFTPIRELFAQIPESRARGYKPGRFSFNVKSGRCENCEGAGTIKIEMHFLPDVYVTCDVCKGKRFSQETLEIQYKGMNIHNILEMTIEEGERFFESIPPIHHKLETLLSVGLGYVKLGQSALTLSGGEAQRVKLSLELSKRSTGKTLYILDEPTTGLHFADVTLLMEVIQRLVDMGNTIILIEHNLDVIAQADWVVDLGPEGGDKGGELVAMGTPEHIMGIKASHTGQFLEQYFRNHPSMLAKEGAQKV